MVTAIKRYRYIFMESTYHVQLIGENTSWDENVKGKNRVPVAEDSGQAKVLSN
jgi:hypothetical protein